MFNKVWLGLRLCVSALWRDTRGAILIYVTVGLTVLLGGAALVIDAGRLYTMSSELQAAADAFALACAAELDRTADSETRALLAVNTLVANKDTYSQNASSGILAQAPIFLSALPADNEALSTATVSTDPSETRFCQVSVQTKTMDTYFIRALTGQTSISTNAVAVAGFDQAVCQFTPLFICNPFDPFNGTVTIDGVTSIGDAVTKLEFRRRQFKLVQLGGNDQASPGNFGYLESPLGPGGQNLAESLAVVSPNTCFIANGVSTKTGATAGPVRKALNVRFDMYKPGGGVGGFNKSDPNYRPAINVRRGLNPDDVNGGTGCAAANVSLNDTPALMGLPRDDCYAPGATPGCDDLSLGTDPNDGRMGLGFYDFETYWATNHGGLSAVPPNLWDNNLHLPSRYEVYRYEIDNAGCANAGMSCNSDPSSDPDPLAPPGGGETGEPQCHLSTATDDPDRRILYAAVVNCANPTNCGTPAQTGLCPGSNSDYVKVEAWIKMFITAPVVDLNSDPANEKPAVFVEIVDVLKAGDDDEVLHDIVQLYR